MEDNDSPHYEQWHRGELQGLDQETGDVGSEPIAIYACADCGAHNGQVFIPLGVMADEAGMPECGEKQHYQCHECGSTFCLHVWPDSFPVMRS